MNKCELMEYKLFQKLGEFSLFLGLREELESE